MLSRMTLAMKVAILRNLMCSVAMRVLVFRSNISDNHRKKSIVLSDRDNILMALLFYHRASYSLIKQFNQVITVLLSVIFALEREN